MTTPPFLPAFAAPPVAHVRVEELKLPRRFTLDPANASLRVDSRGDVAASVKATAGGATGIYVWNADGSTRSLPAPPVARGDVSASLELGAVGPAGEIYAAIVRLTEGAGFFQSEEDVTYRGTAAQPLTTPCARGAALPDFASDDGSLGLTFLADPNGVSADNLQDGTYAPYAALVRGTRCIDLGRAYLTAMRGEYIAGYRGYLNANSHVLGPSVVDTASQYDVAVRWLDLTPHELGPGVAFDVASDGTCVGADALPGAGATHALIWDAAGHARRLVSGDESSVALAIGDDGRAAGSLVDATTKRRYAFVTHGNGVQRLDDLAGDPRWHLQFADKLLPDGRIAGTGMHDGTPAAFIFSDS